MNRSFVIAVVIVVALMVPSFPALAEPQAPPVWPMNVFEDEGTFTYYREGQYVGTSEFTWSKGGRFFNAISVKLGERTVQGTTSISVDDQGLWTSISQQTAKGPAEITRVGSSIEITSGVASKSLELPPGTLLMEDMSPALMSQAVVAYDHEKGGKQDFALFFIPAAMVRGSIEYLESFERSIGDESKTFRKYRYLMLPVYPVEIVVDGANRVCLAEYPVQKGAFVREGYEALRPKEAPAPIEN